MELDFNNAEAEKERLKDLWHTFSSGAVGVANDAQRLVDFVVNVEADDERKNDLIGTLTAGGLSIQKVKTILEGVARIRDAIVAEFPEAIPGA